MPIFTHQLVLGAKPERVFEFLRTPANRVPLAPPEMPLELVEGLALLELGSKVTWRMRRYGVSQTLVFEVTECTPPSRLVEVQRSGPFRKWVQGLQCTEHAEGTLLEDAIDFEPPGGMLGFMVTAKKIQEALAESYAWRDVELRKRLATS